MKLLLILVYFSSFIIELDKRIFIMLKYLLEIKTILKFKNRIQVALER